MTVYVLRHARAGQRRAWKGADELRPLSAVGKRQAAALVDALEHAGVRQIRTSPYVRCRQSVHPLAQRLGIDVEDSDALAEGAPIDQALRLIEKVSDRTAVLCTHGDIIEGVLAHLKRSGVKVGKARLEKGSVWALEMADGIVVEATYLPPPKRPTAG